MELALLGYWSEQATIIPKTGTNVRIYIRRGYGAMNSQPFSKMTSLGVFASHAPPCQGTFTEHACREVWAGITKHKYFLRMTPIAPAV